MGFKHHRSHRDLSEPEIVEALEKSGWEVHRKLPVDLLCIKRVSVKQLIAVLQRFDDESCLLSVPVECKTARGKKNPKAVIDKRQIEQNEFCARWRIDKPTTPEEALLLMGERLELMP